MYHAGDPMVMVNFRLPQFDLDRVLEAASLRGITVSEWLREAVERSLKVEEPK